MSLPAAEHGRRRLRLLVVDDDAVARRALVRLLAADPCVAEVRSAAGSAEALRLLADRPPAIAYDAVLCETRLRGLDGIALARLMSRFAAAPRIVFVTADTRRAVEAFELAAVDYVLKPLRADRVQEAVRRLRAAPPPDDAHPADETISVELAGVITRVQRRDVRYAEADGDYVRLHTADGSHLMRTTLAALERRWSAAGFVRVHRHALVALAHVDAARFADGTHELVVGDARVPVSRRHVADVRARLHAGG